MRKILFVIMLLGAFQVQASMITTVEFDDGTLNSFSFQWDDPANCNPADSSCFVTEMDFDGWTDVSLITNFYAIFSGTTLTEWYLRAELVTPGSTETADYISTWNDVSWKEAHGTPPYDPTWDDPDNTLYYGDSGGGGSRTILTCTLKPGTQLTNCPPTGGNSGGGDIYSWSYTTVPIPSTVLLLGLGLLGMRAARKQKI